MQITKIITSLIAILLTTTIQAKIWRVNNNPGIKGDFTTADQAATYASKGDTIHFEPSIYSYGSVKLTKKLILIGTGYFVSGPPTISQTSINTPFLGVITLVSGADSSVIMVNNKGIMLNHALHVTIQRCYIDSSELTIYHGGYLTIQNCFINGVGIFLGDNIKAMNGCSEVTISNNICDYINTDKFSNNISILNNTIMDQTGIPLVCINCNLTNNIVANKGFSNLINCTIYNDLFANGMSMSNCILSNVISGINMNKVLLNSGILSTSGKAYNDNGFQLVPGNQFQNPAQSGGIHGEDLGAFGGLNPYIQAVQPPIPAIYYLNADSLIADNFNLQVGTRTTLPIINSISPNLKLIEYFFDTTDLGFGKNYVIPFQSVTTDDSSNYIINVNYLSKGNHSVFIRSLDDAGNWSITNGPLFFDKTTVAPVIITQFDAIQENNQVTIKWTAIAEINTDSFIIERSNDGHSYSRIGACASQGSLITAEYHFEDKQLPESQKIYYRLKIIDKGNLFKYSDVKTVVLNKDKTLFSVYPNPARNKTIRLQLNNVSFSSYRVTICNTKGQILQDRVIQGYDLFNSYMLHLNSISYNGLCTIIIRKNDTNQIVYSTNILVE